MFQKSLIKEILTTPKLELHIMLALKCGRTNLMILRVIYGLLAVFFMKWFVSNHLFKLAIWVDFTRKLLEVNFQEFQKHSLKTSGPWLAPYFKLILLRDQIANNLWIWLSFKNVHKSSSLKYQT